MSCNYLGKNRFAVEVGISGAPKTSVGFFKRISGLGKQVVIEEKEIDGGNQRRKFIDGIKVLRPTFIRALAYTEGQDSDIGNFCRDWYYRVHDPQSKESSDCYYMDVDIFVLDRAGFVGRIIRLMTCWPMRYKYPDLDAQSSQIGYEELTLTVKKMEDTMITNGEKYDFVGTGEREIFTPVHASVKRIPIPTLLTAQNETLY